ncbi:MAG: FAD-dependent monooxygenase [Rhizobiales bacterium]|nr:FAD-dependent monooxygenase [Hyphomicrobiales bacterium]
MADLDIAIVGAGVAGLSAALLLSRGGSPVSVFERTAVPYQFGAGLQLSPNAGRILEQLGLGPALDRVAVRPVAIDLCSGQTGRTIVSLPLSHAAARYGSPYRVLHRSDLQAILIEAVLYDRTIDFQLAAPVTDVAAEGRQIGFSIKGKRVRADLMIGADGISSQVRTLVDPAATPILARRTAWRTTIPADSVPNEIPRDRITVFLMERSHIVIYPIRLGREINVVAIVEEDWLADGWAEHGEAAEIVARFRGSAPVVADTIAAGHDWTRWCLRAIQPSGPWFHGGAVLIGDAAHAMLPFLAQGAAMGIEDAAILTRSLANPALDREAALRRYDALRRPRVDRVWRSARQTGRVYHMTPLTAPFRDATMRALGGERLLARYDWLYGWRQND